MRRRALILFALLFVTIPGHAGVEEAVVKIGGCSGVCVDPAGIVLTARHCDHPDVVLVEFPGRTASARRVFVTPQTEGPVAFDCDGDGFPYAPLAASVPRVGDCVWSAGYPQSGNGRSFRRASGALLYGSTFEFRGESFPGNVVGFHTGSGWSGGPLFNERGEVCGLLSSSDAATSVYISFAATKQAYETARQKTPGDEKPTLYVCGSITCGPCRQFKDDYAKDGEFRRRLESAFHLVWIDVDRQRATANEFRVSEVPAFVIPGGARVVGYEGTDWLLAQLRLAKPEISEQPQLETQPSPAEKTEPQPQPPAEKPADPPAEGDDDAQSTPPVSAPPPTADAEAPRAPAVPPPSSQTSDDRIERVLGVAQTAMTVATWLGVTGATGGVGGLVMGGIALLRTIRRARRNKSARDPPRPSTPPVITVDSPPPPQAIVPETRFAPYERDTFAEAFAWAETEMARKYPGAVGTLESLRGLIDQYLSAKGVKKAPAART